MLLCIREICPPLNAVADRNLKPFKSPRRRKWLISALAGCTSSSVFLCVYALQSKLSQGFDAYSHHLCLILPCFQLNSESYSVGRGAVIHRGPPWLLNRVDILHLFKCGRFFHFWPNIRFVSACIYLVSHFHFIVRTEISKYSNLWCERCICIALNSFILIMLPKENIIHF